MTTRAKWFLVWKELHLSSKFVKLTTNWHCDSILTRTLTIRMQIRNFSSCRSFLFMIVILCFILLLPVVRSMGFARFVNIRDGKWATPLHLAARQRRPECVHILLDCGAFLCASTGGYGYPRSTLLHLAARTGSLDCIHAGLGRRPVA